MVGGGDLHPNTEKAEGFLREGWAGPSRVWTREEEAAHSTPAFCKWGN